MWELDTSHITEYDVHFYFCDTMKIYVHKPQNIHANSFPKEWMVVWVKIAWFMKIHRATTLFWGQGGGWGCSGGCKTTSMRQQLRDPVKSTMDRGAFP